VIVQVKYKTGVFDQNLALFRKRQKMWP